MPDIEYRAWAPDDVEMRAEGDGMTFSGRAIVYNAKSEPLPFRELILPGAATRSLKSRNEIKALIGHDPTMVIGSTRAGTLRLAEDERGVTADIDLPDTTYGRDLSVSVTRRDITSMSFGFTVVKDAWNEDYTQRTISELRVHEVSVVAMPAYPQTTALVRALPRLAHRTGLEVEALADAIGALEAGTELNDDQYELLATAIDRSRPARPEPEPEATVPVALLTKQLDLLAKQLGI